ncbi:hypothetical protein [Bradyrhizobium sp. OAE829]|uniref:hypothetical protein n=1 Tax=Bradyrhizobium sp. OAE829 TaxID=2663807 RepID=UPI0019FAD5B5
MSIPAIRFEISPIVLWLTLAEFDHNCQVFGLATTMGLPALLSTHVDIVTSFEYRLHEVGPVLGGSVVFPFTRPYSPFTTTSHAAAQTS